MKQWMAAADAARVLGVSRATLYAYVSRGYVRSQPTPGPSRDRRYSREDVERLRRRTEERREPDKAAARALQWGMPILESSIALIDGQRLYYRGHDAVDAVAIAVGRGGRLADLDGAFRYDVCSRFGGAAIIEVSVRQRSSISRLRTVGAGRRVVAGSFGVRPSARRRGPHGMAHPADADKGRRAFRPSGLSQSSTRSPARGACARTVSTCCAAR